MFSAETSLSYPDWTITFMIHNDASNKQLVDIIIQNNKLFAFFSRRLIKPQHNYTTIEKELLSIVECLNQFHGIIFGYGINVFASNQNLVYAATLNEFQRVMIWRLIIKELGTYIQHIYGVENIVSSTLSRFPYSLVDKYHPITIKSQCCANE